MSKKTYTEMREEILQKFREDIEYLEGIENSTHNHSNLIYVGKPFYAGRKHYETKKG